MTTEPRYAELIARLEKATGRDRQLDGDIAETLKLYPDGTERVWIDAWGGDGKSWDAPEFTASLDAAMTLASSTHDAMVALNVAFNAVADTIGEPPFAAKPDDPFIPWAAIKPMLIFLLKERARKAQETGE